MLEILDLSWVINEKILPIFFPRSTDLLFRRLPPCLNLDICSGVIGDFSHRILETCVQVQNLSHATYVISKIDTPSLTVTISWSLENTSYRNLTDQLNPLLNNLPNKMESNFEYPDGISVVYGC